MDEIYVTYADDEHVDNHDYGDNTDDDHDNNNHIYVSGPDLGRTRTGPRPDRSGPGQTIVIIMIIISSIIIIMIINMLIINISNINFIHGCIIIGVNNIYVLIIMALPL